MYALCARQWRRRRVIQKALGRTRKAEPRWHYPTSFYTNVPLTWRRWQINFFRQRVGILCQRPRRIAVVSGRGW